MDSSSKMPVPREFLPNPGDPVLPFKHWIRLFENFIFSKNSARKDEEKLTDEEKNRFLFTLLGFEGIRQFSSLPVCDKIATVTHETFIAAAKELFDAPVNPFKAYYDFESRNQLPQETTQEYLTSLRSLMADCDFGGRENHHLAVRLACGCHNRDTQKKLLALPNVDLELVLRIMKAEELANSSANAISATPIHKIDKPQVSYKQHQQQQHKATQHKKSTGSSFNKQPSNSHSNKHKTCGNCGYGNHPPNDPKCPANGQQCRTCGKTGHFSKMCRSGKRQGYVKHLKSIKGTKAPFHHSVFLDGKYATPVELSAEVDTGSQISGVTEQFFNKFFSHKLLKPPSTLRNFDGSKIQSGYGRFTTTVRHADRSAVVELHVLPRQCQAVIGQDIIKLLGLQIDGESMTVRSVKDSILKEFPRLMSDEIGLYPNYQHVITIDKFAKPACVRLRPVPLARREKTAKEVSNYDKLGIWEPVDKSNWCHHMVAVPKPNGGIRVTTDLSPLNNHVIPDRFPLPNMKDLFLELKGAKVFSKLDIRKAFFHVALAEESRHLTTTMTHQGLRQYKRLPMGLKDSASVCQRLLSQTLSGCPGCIVYIDDIVIYGRTHAEHDANLRQALKRLEEKDFRLQLDKCVTGVREIKFLGHIISADGIKPDQRNIDPIVKAQAPRTPKQLASFLGMVNFYSDFIPHLATVCEPLRKLQRKGVKFVWSESCQHAFDKLKSAISKGVKNFIFDPNAKTFVTVDASDVGLGATLTQLQQGREVPIAHASHTLQPRERNYAVNEKEALACVWACENWDKYLLGRHFVLRTDHETLTKLLTSSTDSRKSAKFCRWMERLAEFDYTVEYLQGSKNYVADALSRLSQPSTTTAIQDHVPEHAIRQLKTDSISLESIQRETARDQVLALVLRYTSTSWPGKKMVDEHCKPFFHIRDELSVEDGYLLRDERIVVPPSLQKPLIKRAHEGHPGIVRMKRQLRRCYWWPGQDKMVEEFVKRCSGCQRSDKSASPSKVKVSTIPIPANPWEKLGIDICGPFAVAPPSSRFVVVLTDYHSKFPEILLTGTVTSQKIISWLNEVFARYGLPLDIVTDNGPSFVSREFEEYLEKNNIKHTLSSVYTPQQNGLVERFNGYLKTHVQAFTADKEPWLEGIQHLLRHFRATPPTPHGLSPCELLFGRQMRLPHEVPRSSPYNLTKPKSSPNEHEPKFMCRGPYRQGDTVMTRRPQVPKGQSPWSKPLNVLEVLGNYTYRLSDGQKWNARKMRRFLEPTSPVLDDLDPYPPADRPAGRPDAAQTPPRRSARENRGVPPQRYPDCTALSGREEDVVSSRFE